jgi:hypothetical protein
MRPKPIMLAVGVLAGVLVVGFTLLVVLLRSKVPTDAELVGRFHTNRVVLETLRDMLKVDKQIAVVADWGINTTNSPVPTDLAVAGLSEARYQEYRSLMKRAGVLSCISSGSEYRFLVASDGWAGSGYRVAITWTEFTPDHLISSLDEFHKTKNEWEQVYRRLEDGWYLWMIW